MLEFVLAALTGHRLRSGLSALGVAIGVATVILLTSLGEGTRDYIVSQFTQFGTHIIAINPGKTQTVGIPGVLGGTTHKLDIDDAEALRKIPGVEHSPPSCHGPSSSRGRGKGSPCLRIRVTHEMPMTWNFPGGSGIVSAAPSIQGAREPMSCSVPSWQRELFDADSPLGERVRIGGRSFLVVGVMAPKGILLGFDLDDSAYIPVASAMALFNVDELFEIDVLTRSAEAVPSAVEAMRRLLTERHRGQEDFTITTEQEMLDTFGRIINMVTVAVSGIAGISLLVGGVGILTVMWISVHERTNEIGLLRALGLTPTTVSMLFLLEAVFIACIGGLAGVATGFGLGSLIRLFVPGLPLATPPAAVAAALGMSLLVGLASGYLPARRAAKLDPVEALRAE